MRTVYLGTSDFAATVLRRLVDSPHRPLLVVAPPDRRAGRGRRTAPPPVALAAEELGLDLLQTDDVNTPAALEAIGERQPQAGAVCAFGQILREPLLSELELLNVHPSLLPRWRGAAPIERAIMSGDERTGVCVMRVTAGLDSGPVALCREVEIGPEEGFEAIADRLAKLGGELIVEALDGLASGSLSWQEQDDAAATYAEKIDRAERRLDPARTAVELARTVRALTPHIGTYIEAPGGERLGVRRARPLDRGPDSGVIEAEPDALILGCATGGLRIEIVQPPGSKPMPVADYLRGHRPPAAVE